MATIVRRKSSAPLVLTEAWIMPGTVEKDINALRRGFETGNDVVNRVLRGRDVEDIRGRNTDGTVETTNQVIARVLRDAVRSSSAQR